MKYFIGIDPGVTGGLCVIDEAGRLLHLESCPKTLKGQWDAIGRARAVIGEQRLNLMCAIESVHSMPGQGVRSVWTFSGNYHAWLMALVAAEIPYQQISPQRWMKHFGAMPKEKKLRKHRLLHLAEARYPSVKITLALADLVMIATYAKEQLK